MLSDKEKQLKKFPTNISKVSSKTGKALAERDLFSRVIVALEFAEDDIQSQRVAIFFCHKSHCRYLKEV